MTLIPAADPIPLTTGTDGVIRVNKTRLTLDTVIIAFKEGTTPEEIVEQYPSLSRADVYSVIGYYLHHTDEIDNYLQERQNQAEKVRQQAEKLFNPVGIKERLLTRKNSQN